MIIFDPFADESFYLGQMTSWFFPSIKTERVLCANWIIPEHSPLEIMMMWFGFSRVGTKVYSIKLIALYPSLST